MEGIKLSPNKRKFNGKKLKALRERLGMTANELAVELEKRGVRKVSDQSIYFWEERRTIPTANKRVVIRKWMKDKEAELRSPERDTFEKNKKALPSAGGSYIVTYKSGKTELITDVVELQRIELHGVRTGS